MYFGPQRGSLHTKSNADQFTRTHKPTDRISVVTDIQADVGLENVHESPSRTTLYQV